MSGAAHPNLVLIASPRSELVGSLKRWLEAAGMRGIRAGASLEGSLESTDPQVVVVDSVGSPPEAMAMCAAIRSAAPQTVPVLLIVAPGDSETVDHAVELGVSNFAEEPVTPRVLALRIRALALAGRSGDGNPQAEASHSSDCDGLTGLASRMSFLTTMERILERAREQEDRAALLYLDIDRFKTVNDALGHAAGDLLLQHVARVLDGQVRASDVVANGGSRSGANVSRIGGDEFTVLLSKVRSAQDAVDVAHRIIEAMKIPISAVGYQVAATASIGIALFPEDGEDTDSLLRTADMAMYAAKALGRGRAVLYRPSMGDVHVRRLAVEEQLRFALERGEFEVHYQPRIDLGMDRISSAEALLRWRSRELGEIPPKEFIPVAEESGLIVPIGKWVLETACRQLAQWQRAGHDLRISVNVSSIQFSTSDVLRTVTDVLRAARLDPHALELEVTERLMLGGDEQTALSLRDLRGIGVTISLDDFGTGYSSLSSITRYPLDVLKIDRSIAAAVEEDPAAASIVAAVVTLGKSLGLGVVAEGIDAMGQARMLTRLGCDEIQGFLVSPAVEASRMEAILRDWQGLGQCSESTTGAAASSE